MTDPIPALPVFSPRLDEILGLMIKDEIPNVGRFCGYCYTPLERNQERCNHCNRTRAEYAPVAKIPDDFLDLYRRMRKRESLIVNSFAFAGLGIGLLLFIVLVALAVYRYEAAIWMLVLATAVFIVGGRVLAGLLGGWIGDNVGYDYAQKKLAIEWQEYEQARDGAPSHAPAVNATSAHAG
jgi:hypothetical protein